MVINIIKHYVIVDEAAEHKSDTANENLCHHIL